MTRIYAVDDDQVFLTTLEAMLHDCEFQFDTNGTDTIAQLEANTPDIVFLDLQMPDTNGYEICQKIRAHAQLSTLPVLFISASNALEDKVKSLEAGADDFLTKPIEPELLTAKVRLMTHTHATLQSIKTDQEAAQKVAIEAMRGSSEIGQAMQFIERCQVLNNEHDIARELINIAQFYGLNAVVGIRLEHGWLCLKQEGMAAPIEQEVIEQAHSKGRIIDFGARTQINYDHIAILIKNMPIDDPERYGRVKDLLPPILSALNVRLTGLLETKAILEQTELVARSINAVQPTLETLSQEISSLTDANKHNISNLLADMAMRLPRMSLEDDQEEFIMTALENTSDLAEELKQEGLTIQESMSTIANVLGGLLSRQENIAAIVREKFSAPAQEKPEDDFSSDVDLF